jgi:hypothetical protein
MEPWRHLGVTRWFTPTLAMPACRSTSKNHHCGGPDLGAVFGNHWPSRSGGQFESEGYRAIAGETLSYFHQRVLEVHGPQAPVLAMGDFNDEPFDPSLVRHAISTRQANAPSPRSKAGRSSPSYAAALNAPPRSCRPSSYSTPKKPAPSHYKNAL